MQHPNNDKMTTVIPKEDLEAALNNPTIKGVLTRVYKLFVVSFGKDRTTVWNKLMDQYVVDPNNNIPDDRAKQTSAKGNLKREYLGQQLTWLKFCEAMRFAKFTKLKMTFTATDENGLSMRTEELLNFQNATSDDFIEDIINRRVTSLTGDEPPHIGEGTDAKLVALNRQQRNFATRGKDWVSVPKKHVDALIEEFTIKEDNNGTK